MWEHVSRVLLLIVGWATIDALLPWLVFHGIAYRMGFIEHLFDEISFSAHPLLALFGYLLPDKLVGLIAVAAFAVPWHRYVLQGYSSDSFSSLRSWRTYRYLGYAFYLGFLISAVTRALSTPMGGLHVTGTAATSFGQLLAFVVCVFIFGPRMLIFPAVAVGDRTITFWRSDYLTENWRRHWFSFFGGLLLSSLPFLVSSEALVRVAEWWLGLRESPQLAISGIATDLVSFIGIVSTATYLSRSYRALLGESAWFPDK